MSTEFGNLKIDRLAIHEIFKRNEDKQIITPNYSHACLVLDDEAKSKIASRVVKAMGSNSHSIQMDILKVGEGTVFHYVKPLWNNQVEDEIFLEISKNLAYKLSEAQNTRRVPGGVVVVFEGRVGGNSEKYVGIIKAELHEGFIKEEKEEELSLRYLKDLLLTPQQKLYKVALLINKTGATNVLAENVEAYIFDSNNDTSISAAKATYFYEGFMGCNFQRNKDVLTRDFYNYTKLFIKQEDKLSGSEKVDLVSALYSYLKVDSSPNINIKEFSDRYFVDPEIKDRYFKQMEKNNVPFNNIRKDLSMIKDKLKTRKIKFTNNINLYVPVDEFKHVVEIKESDDTHTLINIKAKVIADN